MAMGLVPPLLLEAPLNPMADRSLLFFRENFPNRSSALEKDSRSIAKSVSFQYLLYLLVCASWMARLDDHSSSELTPPEM